MKSLTTFLISITFTAQLFSQELTKEVFIGTWKTVDSQLLAEPKMALDAKGQKMMEQIRTGLIGTTFTFKANNEFTIKFSNHIPAFMKELELRNNKKWKIKKGQIIAIGTEKDGFTLMGISVISKQGKKYFILDESPLILEVVEL